MEDEVNLNRLLFFMLFVMGGMGLWSQERPFNPGLLWREGNAPAPSIALPAGNRIWYVDAAAPNGGDGSAAHPYNSFETCIGGDRGQGYEAGLLRGGDHVYLAGTFLSGSNIAKRIELARAVQMGTREHPTLITAWPGRPRPVLDGENGREFGILIRNGTGIRMEGLEVRRFMYNGIRVMDPVENAFIEIINNEVHRTIIAGGSGVNGGIALETINGCDYTLRNCLVHDNHESAGAFGGVVILSEGYVGNGAIVHVYDNIFFNEMQAIAHKHCGGVLTDVHHNLVHSSTEAFYLRAFRGNQIHHNLVVDCQEAFRGSRENMQGDQHTRIHHNTLVNSGSALTLIDNEFYGHADYYDFFDNLVFSPTQSMVLGLARYASQSFDVARWQSGRNLFIHANGNNFLENQGVARAFAPAMTYLRDTTSRTVADPQFRNLAGRDYRLAATSPARGAGENGSDIGALPYDSSYVLDLNRYTVMPSGTLTVTAPNGGEAWRRGETRSISWTATGITESLVLELMQGPTLLGVIATGVTANAGSYTWTVGRLADGSTRTGNNLKLRIRTTSGQVQAEARFGGQ